MVLHWGVGGGHEEGHQHEDAAEAQLHGGIANLSQLLPHLLVDEPSTTKGFPAGSLPLAFPIKDSSGDCPGVQNWTGSGAGGFAADSVPSAACAWCQPCRDSCGSLALADWQPLPSKSGLWTAEQEHLCSAEIPWGLAQLWALLCSLSSSCTLW